MRSGTAFNLLQVNRLHGLFLSARHFFPPPLLFLPPDPNAKMILLPPVVVRHLLNSPTRILYPDVRRDERISSHVPNGFDHCL